MDSSFTAFSIAQLLVLLNSWRKISATQLSLYGGVRQARLGENLRQHTNANDTSPE
jgi:hypothetical protein